MQELYKDFGTRPDTAAFFRPATAFKSDTFYDAMLGKKGEQNVLKIEEDPENSDNASEKNRILEEEKKRIEELRKELEKINSQNEKLKKDISLMPKGQKAGC
mmetsp:Transcript_1288/g.1371  ORF Transcript_1288/g.1371 Transcript_1288/m.1371 type:complete len:102 (+) Transcript_1288:268-573(+)